MNTIHLYLRASTKEQDSSRALQMLENFANHYHANKEKIVYLENYSGTKIERPQLTKLLDNSQQGDILLVESVDRLTRLTSNEFLKLKLKIAEKGLQLIIHDLPSTHNKTNDTFQQAINSLLIDLLASMARLDQDKRVERIKQGLERSGYKPTGKKKNEANHKKIKGYLEKEMTIKEIAVLVGVGEATVYRVKAEMKGG
jgi:DNA invertase Pin-like site-specific DNA recombinase